MRFSKVFPTVDIAVIDIDNDKILFGRKPGQELFRFPGGFVEPTDNSLEHAAYRELTEEVLGLPKPQEEKDIQELLLYIGSFLIDDPRYRDKEEKIMTSLFIAAINGSSNLELSAGDDIEELKWIHGKDLKEEMIVEEHRPLIRQIFLLR